MSLLIESSDSASLSSVDGIWEEMKFWRKRAAVIAPPYLSNQTPKKKKLQISTLKMIHKNNKI